MTRRIRQPRLDDQDKSQKAYELLKKALDTSPAIDPSLWVGVTLSTIVDSYTNSGLSHEEFCEDMNMVMNHYKSW